MCIISNTYINYSFLIVILLPLFLPQASAHAFPRTNAWKDLQVCPRQPDDGYSQNKRGSVRLEGYKHATNDYSEQISEGEHGLNSLNQNNMHIFTSIEDRILKIHSSTTDLAMQNRAHASRRPEHPSTFAYCVGNTQTLPIIRRKPKLTGDDFRHQSDVGNQSSRKLHETSANPSNTQHFPYNIDSNQPLSIVKTLSTSSGMNTFLSTSIFDMKSYPRKNNRESIV